MRRTTTERSQRTTLRLVLGGKEESGNVYSPFGPVRAGLTTTPIPRTRMENQDRQLSELLNYLERKTQDLSIKSYGVLNTYLNDTLPPVKRINSIYETTIINSMVE